MNAVPVGVCCFHFGLSSTPSGEYTYGRYVDDVRDLLTAVRGLSDLEIGGSFDRDAPIEVPSTLLPMCDAREVVPKIQNHRIDFLLHVSLAEQAKVRGSSFPVPQTFTERFRVSVRPTVYGMPVVFVEPIEPDGASRPYDCGLVVQEAVRARISDAGHELLRLEILQPSPLPVDTILVSEEARFEKSPHVPFAWDYLESRGFDVLSVSYNPPVFKDERAPIVFFETVAGPEVGLIYSIVQLMDAEGRDWSDLEATARKLVGTLLPENRGKDAGSRKTQRDLVEKSTADLAEFELTRSNIRTNLSMHYRILTRSMTEGCFYKTKIERMLELWPVRPIEEVRRITTFAEGRWTHRVSVLTTFVVGFASALIGAAATLIVAWLASGE